MYRSSIFYLIALAAGMTACDSEQLYHQVQVVNGSGSGEYRMGQQVVLKADSAEAEKGFFRWTGDTAFLLETRSPDAEIVMPLRDLFFEATYRDLPKYNLSVNRGLGAGAYLAGTKVRVEAITEDNDEQFVEWTGDVEYLDRRDTAVTFVTIPEKAIVLTAVFEEVIPQVSFKKEVLPLFKKYCATSGCHDISSRNSWLFDYEGISAKAIDVKESILSGFMPQGATMQRWEIELIVRWIDQGAKNN